MRVSWQALACGGLIVGLVLGAVAPATAEERGGLFRGFWVDAFSPGFKSTTEINSLVSRAVAGNYNTIVAEVMAYQDRGSGGHGAYWNSAILPKATDIQSGLDPLAYLVTQAHAAGLEVHAWLVPYRVCTSWPPTGNSLVATHPEWLMVSLADMGGGPATLDGKYMLDPGSPDVQEYLLSIVRELVTNYAIDGINYDYIRYTQKDAGYPADANYEKSSLARFRILTWYSGTPAPEGVTSWDNFRRRTIDEFVRRSRAEIPSITSNPRQPVALTADLICWGNAPANFNSSSAYGLFQNWKMWMERGYLDAGIPMNYKREHDGSEAQWYRNWVSAAIGWRSQRHMYCGQGNYLNTKANSVAQLVYCYSVGADGTCNYCYYDTADENMNGTPETDWTWYTYVATNLFTSPEPAPEMWWRDIGAAVEGTLWGRVADPYTGNPIDGAVVQLGTLPAVETDGNGYYVITMAPAGPSGTSYDLAASKYGCPSTQVPGIVVLPGRVVRQDVDLCNSWTFGDMDEDGDVDLTDFNAFGFCMAGPGITFSDGHFCLNGDADDERDVDLADFAVFQQSFQGP